MKKLLLISNFLMAFAISGFGQGGHHGSGSNPTKPGAPTTPTPMGTAGASGSGSSQIVQGYHYRLSAKRHVRYKSVIPASYVPTQGVPLEPTYTKDRVISFQQGLKSSSDPMVAPPGTYYVANGKKVFNFSLTNSTPAGDIAHTRLRDTLSRYFDHPTRVAITQGDSGKLQVQFYSRLAQQSQGQGAAPANQIDVQVYKDQTFDAAIPVSQSDSAQNFFIQVRNTQTLADPIYYFRVPYYVWQYGATTIPFRYRFGTSKKTVTLSNNTTTPPVPTTYPVPAEGTANISLAAYFGYKFGASRFYYDQTKSHNTVSGMFSFFGGPTLVPLTANNISSGSDLNKYPAQLFTWSGGVSFTVELGALNLGAFGGIDVPLQNTPWVYANRPWLGFGIGFNLGMLTSSGNVGP